MRAWYTRVPVSGKYVPITPVHAPAPLSLMRSVHRICAKPTCGNQNRARDIWSKGSIQDDRLLSLHIPCGKTYTVQQHNLHQKRAKMTRNVRWVSTTDFYCMRAIYADNIRRCQAPGKVKPVRFNEKSHCNRRGCKWGCLHIYIDN